MLKHHALKCKRKGDLLLHPLLISVRVGDGWASSSFRLSASGKGYHRCSLGTRFAGPQAGIVQVQVILRPTVSRPVRANDQILIFFVRQFLSSSYRPPSLTR
jgi:hypothetical protein